jgi:hypothetical protein
MSEGGTGAPTLAMYVSDSNAGLVGVSDCRFVNAPPKVPEHAAGGLQIGPYNAASTLRALVTGNHFEYVGQQANYIGAIDFYEYCHDSVVANNVVRSPCYSGIKAANSHRLIVQGNIVASGHYPFKAAGIFYSGDARDRKGGPWHDTLIEGNIVRGLSGSAGIHLAGRVDTGSRRHVVVNNIVDDCRAGVVVDGVAEVELSGNVINATGGATVEQAGITLANIADTVTVRHCSIRGGAAYGIAARTHLGGARLMVDGCDFSGNALQDIYVADPEHAAASVVVQQCRFRGQSGVLLVKNVESVSLTGNTAESATVQVVSQSVARQGNDFGGQGDGAGSGQRYLLEGWRQNAVRSTQEPVEPARAAGRPFLARAGSVTGLAIRSSAPIRRGSIIAQVTLDGRPMDGAALALTEGAGAGTSFGAGRFSYEAGAELSVTVSSRDLSPSPDVRIAVEVEG